MQVGSSHLETSGN